MKLHSIHTEPDHRCSHARARRIRFQARRSRRHRRPRQPGLRVSQPLDVRPDQFRQSARASVRERRQRSYLRLPAVSGERRRLEQSPLLRRLRATPVVRGPRDVPAGGQDLGARGNLGAAHVLRRTRSWVCRSPTTTNQRCSSPAKSTRHSIPPYFYAQPRLPSRSR